MAGALLTNINERKGRASSFFHACVSEGTQALAEATTEVVDQSQLVLSCVERMRAERHRHVAAGLPITAQATHTLLHQERAQLKLLTGSTDAVRANHPADTSHRDMPPR